MAHHGNCPCDRCAEAAAEWDWTAEQACGGCGAPRYEYSFDSDTWGWNDCGCELLGGNVPVDDEPTGELAYPARDLALLDDDTVWF